MTVQINRPKIRETQVATGDLDHRRGLPSPNRGNTASPIWVMHALLLASCGGGGGGGSSGTPPATNSMTGATTTSPTGTPPPLPTKASNQSLNFTLSSTYHAIPEGTTDNRVPLAQISTTTPSATLKLTGADKEYFTLSDGRLFLNGGQILDYEAADNSDHIYQVGISASANGYFNASASFTLAIEDVDEKPSALILSRDAHSVEENTPTNARIKMADITVTDDALGTYIINLIGPHANAFELYDGDLYLRRGTNLNYEDNARYTVSLSLSATGTGANPANQNYSLTLTDVDEKPSALALSRTSHSLDENSATASRIKMADITITDDALGTNTLSLAGTDAASFELHQGDLYLKSGVSLNYESKSSYSVSVAVSGTGTGTNPASQSFTLTLNDINEAPSVVTANKNVVTGDTDKSDYILAASDFSVTDEDDSIWAAITITALPTLSSVTLDYNDSGTWKEIIADSLVVSGDQIKLSAVGKISRSDINKLRFSPDADYQAPANGGKPSFTFTLHDRSSGSADKTGNLFTLTVNQRPTASPILSQIVTASMAYSLDLNSYFTDLDDATLSGSWALSVSGAGTELPTGLSLHTSGVNKSKITGTGTSTTYGKYVLTASYTDGANSSVTTSTSFDLFYLEAGTVNADGTRTTPLSKQYFNALAGDDVISGSSAQDVILGGSGNDFIRSGGGADILDGGAGQDTLSFAGITTAITFSLVGTKDKSGYLSASGGSTARVRGFEHVIGGSGADTLTGDDKANVIEGGPGGDTLRGGGGVDTVSYAHSGAGVHVRLNSTTHNTGGDAAGDNIGGFENILGSAHHDILRGDLSINGIDGGAGADTLKGGTPSKGRDIMTGGTGNDVFELAGFTPDEPNRAQNDIRLSSYQETRAVVITDFAAGDRLKVPDGVTKVFITKNNHANTGRTATDGNDTNTKDTMIFNWKAEGTNRTELIAILEDYTGTLTGDDFVGTVTASYFSL